MEIRGIIPPIITPMNEDEEINFIELRNQIDRLIAAGVHGIFACGTNGEGYALSEHEKELVIETVVERTAGRVPVYGGVGCITTRDTVRLAQRAEDLGCDVLSIITPSFAQASQDELYEHYSTVARQVTIPIVLYNIPARTGNSLAVNTVRRLADFENIIGIKDSNGNFDQMLKYLEATKGKDFKVISGNDSLILWNLMAGGVGGISGCANVYPQNMVSIYENYRNGDFDAARQSQDAIRSLRDVFQFGNPNTIVKTAVSLLGYPVGKCRRPFSQLSDNAEKALQQVLDDNKAKGMA